MLQSFLQSERRLEIYLVCMMEAMMRCLHLDAALDWFLAD